MRVHESTHTFSVPSSQENPGINSQKFASTLAQMAEVSSQSEGWGECIIRTFGRVFSFFRWLCCLHWIFGSGKPEVKYAKVPTIDSGGIYTYRKILDGVSTETEAKLSPIRSQPGQAHLSEVIIDDNDDMEDLVALIQHVVEVERITEIAVNNFKFSYILALAGFTTEGKVKYTPGMLNVLDRIITNARRRRDRNLLDPEEGAALLRIEAKAYPVDADGFEIVQTGPVELSVQDLISLVGTTPLEGAKSIPHQPPILFRGKVLTSASEKKGKASP